MARVGVRRLFGHVLGIGLLFICPVLLDGHAFGQSPASEMLPASSQVSKPWLGVRIDNVSSQLAAQLGLDTTKGAVITEVTPSGPGAQAGLMVDDVVLRFDNVEVIDPRDLAKRVAAAKIGTEVSLLIYRNGGFYDVKATLGRWPTEQIDGARPAIHREDPVPGGSQAADQQSGNSDTSRRSSDGTERYEIQALGLTLAHPQREGFGDDEIDAVEIFALSNGSIAEKAGLSQGEGIAEINGTPVQSPAEAAQLLNEAIESGRPVSLLVQSDILDESSERRTIVLTLAGKSPSNSGQAGEGTSADQLYWQSVMDSQSIEELQSYLDKFPNGLFADLARLRIRRLEKGASRASMSPSPITTETRGSAPPEAQVAATKKDQPKQQVPGWLGAKTRDLSKKRADELGLNNVAGALVTEVDPDSPADLAGIREGDVILKAGNVDVLNAGHLSRLISDAGADATINLLLYRDREEESVDVQLMSRGAWVDATASKKDDTGAGEQDFKNTPRSAWLPPCRLKERSGSWDVETEYRHKSREYSTVLVPDISQTASSFDEHVVIGVVSRCKNSCVRNEPSSRALRLTVQLKNPRSSRANPRFQLRRSDTGETRYFESHTEGFMWFLSEKLATFDAEVMIGKASRGLEGFFTGEPEFTATAIVDGQPGASTRFSMAGYAAALAAADRQLAKLQDLTKSNRCDRNWRWSWDWTTVSMADCNQSGLSDEFKGAIRGAIAACTHLVEHELRSADDLARAYHARGELHLKLRDGKGIAQQQAIADFSKAIDINPRQVESYLARAEAYSSLQQDGKSIDDVTKAIEISPTASSYRQRALYHLFEESRARRRDDDVRAREHYQHAVADYTRAVELDPQAESYRARAEFYHNVHSRFDPDDYRWDGIKPAIADYIKLDELDPDKGHLLKYAELLRRIPEKISELGITDDVAAVYERLLSSGKLNADDRKLIMDALQQIKGGTGAVSKAHSFTPAETATFGDLAVAAPTTPAPSGPSLWTHNGSVMKLVAEGPSRRFYYVDPRQGIRNQGVTPGTLMFEGERIGDRYVGTAYVFSRQCGAMAYGVTGEVAPDQRSIRLYGQAPRRDAECRVTGYRDDDLLFEYVGSAPTATTTRTSHTASTYMVSDDVSGGSLNVRRGPGTGHPIVVGIPAGATGVSVGSCRRPDDSTSRHDWCEVEWRGFTGWASSCCLVPDR